MGAVVKPSGHQEPAISIVRFLPEDRSIWIDGPTDVFQAAASCDILLEQPCAGASSCGKCRLRVVAGAVEPSSADREALTPAELDEGWRLGCGLTLRDTVTIEVPSSSRSVAAKAFGDDADVDPGRIPVFEGLDTSGRGPCGIAVDIGTTSLAAALVRLDSGHIDAAASMLNPQVTLGADVMSRIQRAAEGDGGRGLLMDAVRRGISSLVDRLLEEVGACSQDIVAATVVGNPTMLHLWYGADPSTLGVAPYLGLWTHPIHAVAGDLGLPILPVAPVYVLPCVKSHVGADAVAAAVAVGLDQSESVGLLIDLGTNSEIVIGSARETLAASTSAGPAFEGAGISCGMRAGEGAIDALHIETDGRWSVHTVGDVPPRGICGSGLLDAVAELVRVGVIDAGGYMRAPEELAAAVPVALRQRIEQRETSRAVRIVDEGSGHRRVELRATDVRQLQLAIAAIRAGIDMLCEEAGVHAADLHPVFVAGTFGRFVRKSGMLRLGLVPGAVAERARTVGNAAGLGARLALLDQRFRVRAERFASRTRYIELAGRGDYAEALTRALRFPEESRHEAAG